MIGRLRSRGFLAVTAVVLASCGGFGGGRDSAATGAPSDEQPAQRQTQAQRMEEAGRQGRESAARAIDRSNASAARAEAGRDNEDVAGEPTAARSDSR